MYASEHDNESRNDTLEQARNALDTQARQLRNLAKRVSSPVIDTVTGIRPDLPDRPIQAARGCAAASTRRRPRHSTDRGRLWTGELSVPDSSVGDPGHGRACAALLSGQRLDDDAWGLRPASPIAVPASIARCSPTAAQSGTRLHDKRAHVRPGHGGIAARDARRHDARLRAAGAHRAAAAFTCATRTRRRSANLAWSSSSLSRTVVLNASGSVDFEGAHDELLLVRAGDAGAGEHRLLASDGDRFRGRRRHAVGRRGLPRRGASRSATRSR